MFCCILLICFSMLSFASVFCSYSDVCAAKLVFGSNEPALASFILFIFMFIFFLPHIYVFNIIFTLLFLLHTLFIFLSCIYILLYILWFDKLANFELVFVGYPHYLSIHVAEALFRSCFYVFVFIFVLLCLYSVFLLFCFLCLCLLISYYLASVIILFYLFYVFMS